MTYAAILNLAARIEALPAEPDTLALVGLLTDAGHAVTVMAAAMKPFAQVAHYGTPSDCNGMLQQADWERVAQMFAPPKAQG